MEHESFENEETAKFMNEHFVNIKGKAFIEDTYVPYTNVAF